MTTSYALVAGGVVINLVYWDGTTVVDFGPGVSAVPATPDVGIGYTYDGTTFAAPPLPPVSLTDARAAQAAAVDAACAAAIVSGFTSSALGAPYAYPSKPNDQRNMIACVTASDLPGTPTSWLVPFWCADANGNWAFRVHNAAQIQIAGQAGMTQIMTYQAKNASLQAQIAAATDIATVESIVWA
jgi:hypothetical protein